MPIGTSPAATIKESSMVSILFSETCISRIADADADADADAVAVADADADQRASLQVFDVEVAEDSRAMSSRCHHISFGSDET
ncbi:hypothetical protein [Paracoccus sp. (in: a-proteobacteria)]|uniref:hypothetical protein n=1 Tax=Paracoccus sp. TaxID=267 RepID=UPI002AFFFA5B|nr:hypothetical protein [Paracoccus sp. (in: a-proteobacteria)]